jgi:hypothetical protein
LTGSAATATAVAFAVANVDERDVVPNLYDKVHGLLIGGIMVL